MSKVISNRHFWLLLVLFAIGVILHYPQQILGHNSLEMVRRYVHLASSQSLKNGKTPSPVDQMGVKRLRGYKIDRILSKTDCGRQWEH
jgi:hypothetical protein